MRLVWEEEDGIILLKQTNATATATEKDKTYQ
jgi:hypothetical protein